MLNCLISICYFEIDIIEAFRTIYSNNSWLINVSYTNMDISIVESYKVMKEETMTEGIAYI